MNFNLNDWLSQVFEFQNFGKGGSTIYLNRIDKTKFTIVNNKSNEALKILGYRIQGDFISEYHAIEKAQLDLIKKFPELRNFYVADALTHFLIGTEGGKKYLTEAAKDFKERYKPIKYKHDEMINENIARESLLGKINIPQNLILYGPPGTGKTYKLINNYIKYFIDIEDGKTKEKRYELITFHQSYSYEEFIEGIRPVFDEDEELRYKIEPGIFLRIAEKARKDNQNNYAIFIDEINRGNISKIFGELITLIEPDKRQGAEHEIEVVLPYSKSKFSVPSNLYIIGTMNTADRSIALIDTALRRRFCFREMLPDTSLLKEDVDGINLQLLLSKMNERIEFLLDRDHTIGHSFFMQANSKNEICAIFKNKIIPLFQEYFYNDWEKLQLVLGDNKSWGKTEEQKLVRVKKHYDLSAEKELFGTDLDDFEDEIIYEINPALEAEYFDRIPAGVFIQIYQKPVKTMV